MVKVDEEKIIKRLIAAKFSREDARIIARKIVEWYKGFKKEFIKTKPSDLIYIIVDLKYYCEISGIKAREFILKALDIVKPTMEPSEILRTIYEKHPTIEEEIKREEEALERYVDEAEKLRKELEEKTKEIQNLRKLLESIMKERKEYYEKYKEFYKKVKELEKLLKAKEVDARFKEKLLEQREKELERLRKELEELKKKYEEILAKPEFKELEVYIKEKLAPMFEELMRGVTAGKKRALTWHAKKIAPKLLEEFKLRLDELEKKIKEIHTEYKEFLEWRDRVMSEFNRAMAVFTEMMDKVFAHIASIKDELKKLRRGVEVEVREEEAISEFLPPPEPEEVSIITHGVYRVYDRPYKGLVTVILYDKVLYDAVLSILKPFYYATAIEEPYVEHFILVDKFITWINPYEWRTVAEEFPKALLEALLKMRVVRKASKKYEKILKAWEDFIKCKRPVAYKIVVMSYEYYRDVFDRLSIEEKIKFVDENGLTYDDLIKRFGNRQNFLLAVKQGFYYPVAWIV